ncbi:MULTISPECIES: RidA family protein [unclassified Acidisoma]|jgi:2-iminobutanoate/2-iminopropanoate deaminase|uniref:RidA family protein n=1 Tax=unclassified Acidisoma TaxID=2634065 RepID=UPI00131CC925|nr:MULTISPECIES: RidA family protein [unclassified Acidisoma]
MFRVIETGLARTPNAPLNGTVQAGPYLLSTHIPKDPQTAEVLLGDMQAQARRTLANVKQSVEAAGGTIADVTQVIVFIINASDFLAFNEVYREFFTEPFPSRSTVVVKELLVPGMLIECVVHAYLG